MLDRRTERVRAVGSHGLLNSMADRRAKSHSPSCTVRGSRLSMDSDVYSNVRFLSFFFDYGQIIYKIYYVNS